MTSEPLPDVLVVGGGVIGASVAHALAVRGAAVMLLADGAPGATMAAAGMLCPSFEAMQTGGRTLAAMGARSLALWDGFAWGLADDPARALGYDRSGVIGVGFPPAKLSGAPVPVPEGLEAGRAVLVEGEGQVDPRLLLTALEAACARAGVRRVRGRAASLITEDDHVRGTALMDGGVLRADRTVVASGAGALVPGLAMHAVRGRAFLVRNTPGLTRVVRSPSVYLAPKPNGTLYVGATEEEEGASRDGPAAPEGLWSEALWLAPSLRGAAVLARFDGLRPRTADELPVIGRHETLERLWVASGHHRNGVLLAPLTAQLIADDLLGSAPA